MYWVFFALMGPFLWAIGNVLNKIIRTKHVDCTVSYTIFIGFSSLLSLAVIPFYGLDIPNIALTSLCILAGMLQAVGCILYIKTLSFEEVSRVIPLFRFVAIFVLIFATVFLGETLTTGSYIAFFMLITGGFLIAVKKAEGVFRLSKAFYLIILSSLFYATADVLVKYISGYVHFSTYFVLTRLGFWIVSLVLLLIYYNRFKLILAVMNRKTFAVIALTEVLGLVGLFSAFYAISIAPISLINAVESFQPLFVFAIASLLSFKFPSILKEELTWKTLLIKGFSIVVMISGLLIIYLK